MTIETPNATDTEALALARRSGWPTELKALLTHYPREQWQGHANLGAMARFCCRATPCSANSPP